MDDGPDYKRAANLYRFDSDFRKLIEWLRANQRKLGGELTQTITYDLVRTANRIRRDRAKTAFELVEQCGFGKITKRRWIKYPEEVVWADRIDKLVAGIDRELNDEEAEFATHVIRLPFRAPIPIVLPADLDTDEAKSLVKMLLALATTLENQKPVPPGFSSKKKRS